MSGRSSSLLSLLLLVSVPVSLAAADDARTLAQRVAEAAGLSAWSAIDTLHFSFTHHPSDTTRRYRWRVDEGLVTVQIDDAEVEIPADGPRGDDPGEQEVQAHKAFVNDSYWLLFPLQVVWDPSVALRRKEAGPIPQWPDLGPATPLVVEYPDSGGYTPGDTYVLYIGAEDRPLAWAYHPGGQEEAKFVISWQDWQPVAGLQVPTRFTTPDGEAFITLTASVP